MIKQQCNFVNISKFRRKIIVNCLLVCVRFGLLFSIFGHAMHMYLPKSNAYTKWEREQVAEIDRET